MWAPDAVVRTLREGGELWEAVPGLIGLRGDALALFRWLEGRIAALAYEETADEWRVPAGVSFETLADAEYFASFPQWLTAASHLSEDPAVLERVAAAPQPATAASASLAPAGAALAPAVCYHTYAAFVGREVASPTRMTAQATCWRHEGPRLTPLARGWAFTMREIVCLGTDADVESFRRRWIDRAAALAAELGIEAKLVEASDPFFAPTARGKALLQRLKALKHELMLATGPDSATAGASFNAHERFFGETFGIRLETGETAATGCVAFGLERWLLAYLCAHGPDAAAWPIGIAEWHPSRSD